MAGKRIRQGRSRRGAAVHRAAKGLTAVKFGWGPFGRNLSVDMAHRRIQGLTGGIIPTCNTLFDNISITIWAAGGSSRA
jgi:hypothetical protein